jgi:DNA polymerase-3 subunit chi
MRQQDKPRIDFYKLGSQNRTSINRFCCLLADKVVKTGNPVFIRTANEAETRLLDDIMWTFSDSSFVPHAILGDAEDPDAAVIIGHDDAATTGYLLINLSDELPGNPDNYQRIAEIINDAPQTLQRGRARYAAYKKQAYPLHYHEIAP